MIPIVSIDPLNGYVPLERAQELGTIVDAFAAMTALTVRQKKEMERLMTSTYLAGRQDQKKEAADD